MKDFDEFERCLDRESTAEFIKLAMELAKPDVEQIGNLKSEVAFVSVIASEIMMREYLRQYHRWVSS